MLCYCTSSSLKPLLSAIMHSNDLPCSIRTVQISFEMEREKVIHRALPHKAFASLFFPNRMTLCASQACCGSCGFPASTESRKTTLFASARKGDEGLTAGEGLCRCSVYSYALLSPLHHVLNN